MSQNERSPLLATQSSSSKLFPAYLGEQQSPPPYKVIEVAHADSSPIIIKDKPRQPGGIASTPFVALIALGIAIVLIFGITLITPEEQQVIRSVLKQSKPSESTGYKDITIPQGRLRGYTKVSREGRDYTAFYKVPYAEPPIEDLRFKDPVAPRSSWQGLRSIPVVAPQCIQKEKYSDTVQAVGEEDCLYANIYVPNRSQQESSPLPVMVYVHGGGFTDGNGSRYGADYFMDEDVILITFQYRLGPFGFLNTNDDVIHGNMGFKDQVQMLKWTRDNAVHFGGDPNKVTIFGNSAGAMSVSFLMLSPMANGLFHTAITQSGASICAAIDSGGMLDTDTMKTVREVGSTLNCDSTDTTELLNCLRTKDASEIALVRTPTTIYALSVEKRSDDQVFMPDTPYKVLKSNPNRVPYIVGVVKSEWTGQGLNLVMNGELTKNLNEDFAKYGAEVVNADLSDEELLRVKEFYFGDKEIGNATLMEAIDLVSDRGLIHCSYVSAHMHSDFSTTYLYYFSKPPEKSYADKAVEGFPAKELGIVSHADELQYFFLYDGYPEIPNGDPEYFEFSRYLVKQWATFATNGAPTSDWEPISSTSNSTFWFELNENPGRTEVMRERMDFWDQFTHKQLRYDSD